MPITPLHFGILAPLNHWMPHRFNNLAFIGANLAMDMEAIMYWFAKLPLPEHSWLPHSFFGGHHHWAIHGPSWNQHP
jgi:hypothetical protein